MVSFSLINAIDPTTIIFVVLLALLIVALLVVPMFTNKKRAKQTDELHRSLQPGDKIKTIGGIVGTIIEIRQISPVDKEMVIETGVGDNKTTMVFDIQALYQIISRNSTIVPAKEESEAEAQEEPEATEPARVVPDIVADRVSEPEAEAKEESAAPEQAAAKDEAENAVEPEAAPVAEEKAEEKPAAKTAQKNGGAKKTTGGANKSKKK